jgi:hypothetical protein
MIKEVKIIKGKKLKIRIQKSTNKIENLIKDVIKLVELGSYSYSLNGFDWIEISLLWDYANANEIKMEIHQKNHEFTAVFEKLN